jgi:hypothetical protein
MKNDHARSVLKKGDRHLVRSDFVFKNGSRSEPAPFFNGPLDQSPAFAKCPFDGEQN